MKRVTRLALLTGLLFILTAPAQGQNPAVLLKPGSTKESVKFTLKNLRTITITVGMVELRIFDQKTCRELCRSRVTINRPIKSCQTLNWEMRCKGEIRESEGLIYYLRVLGRGGPLLTEEWLFVP